MTDAPDKPAKKPFPPPWVLSTYFAEGFPYSVVHQISTVFFKDAGASLEAVGMTSLYRLPWVLKFVWAPLADAFSTKRRWMLAVELALLAALAAMAVGSALPHPLAAVAALFLVTAFLAATHDIVIDGFYLEALDKKSQGAFVGYQAMAYRLAMITGGGGIVAFSGFFGWPAGFALASCVIGALLLFHFAFLPKVEVARQPAYAMATALARGRRPLWILLSAAVAAGVWQLWVSAPVQDFLAPAKPVLDKLSLPNAIAVLLLLAMVLLLLFLKPIKRRIEGSDSFYARAFVDYLDQERIGVALAFLVTYRTGESFLLAMVYPMLKDIGMSRAQYGVIYGTFGIAASIAGGILGGHLIGKFGLKRVIWPMVLAQNVPNLLYMALAFLYRDFIGHPEAGSANPAVVVVFVVMEALGAGMGIAVFMVFIQRSCKAGFRSAHYSIATSIMNVSTTLAGVFSGFLAKWMGWPLFFLFTFLATVPSMALIPFLPFLGEKDRE